MAREIVFSAQAIYSGTKRIDVEFNPYNDKGEYSPIASGFRIEKPKNSDTWQVSKRRHAPTDALHVFDYDYIGSEKNLRKVKAWAREQLMKEA